LLCSFPELKVCKKNSKIPPIAKAFPEMPGIPTIT